MFELALADILEGRIDSGGNEGEDINFNLRHLATAIVSEMPNMEWYRAGKRARNTLDVYHTAASKAAAATTTLVIAPAHGAVDENPLLGRGAKRRSTSRVDKEGGEMAALAGGEGCQAWWKKKKTENRNEDEVVEEEEEHVEEEDDADGVYTDGSVRRTQGKGKRKGR